ncbi:MAG: hypothetical protein GXP30_04625 [Verrucomicrobia bacterium]|nr:hypothetical protein [Verrucomicrobiota bacterium]
MSSTKNNSVTITSDDLDLHFPDPEKPLCASHLRSKISWESWVQEMTPAWKRYMEKYDSREQRMRDPEEKRFVL